MQFVKDSMVMFASETTVCRIDWTGIDLKRTDGLDKIEGAACFLIDTYKKLVSEADEGRWDMVFYSVNDFMKKVDVETQRDIANFYIDTWYYINNRAFETMEDVEECCHKIRDDLYLLATKTGLKDKLTKYITDGNIPIPDLSDVGQRAQDRSELTFGYDEHVALTEISLVCKMMTPIWGTLIYKTAKKLVQTDMKESQYCTLLGGYFSLYGSLIEKFYNFIMNLVNGNKRIETRYYNGNTPNNLTLFVFGHMFVKQFVNIDLLKKDPNPCKIMTYVNTCAKNTIDSRDSGMSEKNSARSRLTFESEEKNHSYLEEDSRSSTVPSDIPVIVEHAIERIVQDMITNHRLLRSVYESAIHYYQRNPIQQTPLNYFIASTMIGHKIGGAAGLSLIDSLTYNKIIAVIQLFMISNGFTVLAELMSLTATDEPQTGSISKVNSSIRFNIKSSEEYRNCNNLFPARVGNIGWDSSLLAIVDMMTLFKTYHNVAPSLLEMMDKESDQNGTLVHYTDGLVRQVCSFILYITRTILEKDLGVEN